MKDTHMISIEELTKFNIERTQGKWCVETGSPNDPVWITDIVNNKDIVQVFTGTTGKIASVWGSNIGDNERHIANARAITAAINSLELLLAVAEAAKAYVLSGENVASDSYNKLVKALKEIE